MKNKSYSIESESATLGCVLLNDEQAQLDILSNLDESDFYSSAHRNVFLIMKMLQKENKSIDFVTVNSKLEEKDLLEEAGGTAYLTEVSNSVPSSVNYKAYMDTVKRYSIKRKIINSMEKIKQKANGNEDPSALIEYAERQILDLDNQSNKKDYNQMKEQTEGVLTELEDIAKDPDKLRGVKTDFYRLDEVTNGLQKSDLILVAARPSVGKTSFAMNIVNNAALKENAKVAVFSLEMSEKQLIQRSLCSIGKVNSTMARKGKLGVNDWRKIISAKKQFDNTTIFIDDNSLSTPMQILSKCRKIKNSEGLDLVMIDYLQLMSLGGRKKTDNRQQEVSEITRMLKIAARELDVPIVLLSQLSRAVETRRGGRPILSDLRESGAIEQDADIVMFLHNPRLYDDSSDDEYTDNETIDLIIAKHRNGALDNIKLNFVKPYTTFYDLNYDSNLKSIDKESKKQDVGLVKIEDNNIDDIFN